MNSLISATTPQKILHTLTKSKMERIDVHTHCVPPSYREYCLHSDFAGRGHPDGMPAIPVSPSETEYHTPDTIDFLANKNPGMERRSTHRTNEPAKHQEISTEHVLPSNTPNPGQRLGRPNRHPQRQHRHVQNLRRSPNPLPLLRVSPPPRRRRLPCRNRLCTGPSWRSGVSDPDQFAWNLPG